MKKRFIHILFIKKWQLLSPSIYIIVLLKIIICYPLIGYKIVIGPFCPYMGSFVQWINEWMDERTDGRMVGRSDCWTDERTNGRTDERFNGQTRERANVRTKGRQEEWMNLYKFSQSLIRFLFLTSNIDYYELCMQWRGSPLLSTLVLSREMSDKMQYVSLQTLRLIP